MDIITSTDPLLHQLKYLYEQAQKGQTVSYQGRLLLATYDHDLRFVELDPETPERRDPSGRWGKYQYLGDPDERNH